MPNDILIEGEDTKVSRSHCRIFFSEALRTSYPLSIEMCAFLMGRSARSRSIIPKLPRPIVSEVFTFLRTKNFYLQDLSTIYGTYLRVGSLENIKENDMLLIGPRTGVTFKAINGEPGSWEVFLLLGEPCGYMQKRYHCKINRYYEFRLCGNYIDFQENLGELKINIREASEFGVWKNISGFKDTELRHRQCKVLLKKEDEIRISSSVFRISWK